MEGRLVGERIVEGERFLYGARVARPQAESRRSQHVSYLLAILYYNQHFIVLVPCSCIIDNKLLY